MKDITIRAPRAVLDAWTKALEERRLPDGREITRAVGVMTDGENGYCCLGVLQMVVSNEIVRDPNSELPSMAWLEQHGIEFFDDPEGGCVRDPFLPMLNEPASDANDGGDYDFDSIAKAIRTCSEATDA